MGCEGRRAGSPPERVEFDPGEDNLCTFMLDTCLGHTRWSGAQADQNPNKWRRGLGLAYLEANKSPNLTSAKRKRERERYIDFILVSWATIEYVHAFVICDVHD